MIAVDWLIGCSKDRTLKQRTARSRKHRIFPMADTSASCFNYPCNLLIKRRDTSQTWHCGAP
jgi:hypothetical protein